MSEEILSRSALEQAEAIRSGEASSRELVEASLEAIDRHNEELNAFVLLRAEEALAEADAIEAGDERPFAGVPMAIKDLIALTKGVRTTMGMNAMEDWAPAEDSAVIRRLLHEAGAIMVGKTNLPELGLLPVTEPERFGPARNPWDTSRTPGGSSGGSGAAVAAGLVSLGHGGDGGGSIRIPASCCGLVGLKPSRGRVSPAPEFAELVSGFATEGVLSRDVADTAAALDALSGYEPGDVYWAPDPSAPFAEAARRDPGKLRIAFTTDSPNGAPVDEEVVAATRATAQLLDSLGHEVEEAAPDWADEGYIDNFILVWAGSTAEEVKLYGALKGEELDRERFEPLTRRLVEIADSVPIGGYLTALDYLRKLARRIVRFWNQHDILVTPTLNAPALEIGALAPAEGEPPEQWLTNSAGWVPLTPVYNVTGQPAISLPLHQSEAGLPIGIQFGGHPAGEEMLLSLAGQLEQAAPWADRRPALATA
jgi:amidase